MKQLELLIWPYLEEVKEGRGGGGRHASKEKKEREKYKIIISSKMI